VPRHSTPGSDGYDCFVSSKLTKRANDSINGVQFGKYVFLSIWLTEKDRLKQYVQLHMPFIVCDKRFKLYLVKRLLWSGKFLLFLPVGSLMVFKWNYPLSTIMVYLVQYLRHCFRVFLASYSHVIYISSVTMPAMLSNLFKSFDLSGQWSIRKWATLHSLAAPRKKSLASP